MDHQSAPLSMKTSAKPKIRTSDPATTSPSMERVEAWTVSQVADVLSAVSISSPVPARSVRGTSVKIDIPLDESAIQDDPPKPKPSVVQSGYKRREPIRRDSLKRREALLKGKEGSRQRRRWENDRLLGNPHAQPPLPQDWQIQPTYSYQTVPYFLAPLWDAEYARVREDRRKRAEAAKVPATKEDAAAAKVKQELKAKLKKSRNAKNLLQDLEEEVRGFVEKWEEKQRQLESEGLIEPDSEDDEIVFVGRSGAMSDEKRRSREAETLKKDKLIFQSLVDDHGASFGYDQCIVICCLTTLLIVLCRRYLVHSIGQYYGLKTWSITTGHPARREAYVGLKMDPKTRRPSLTRTEMPRPLWAVV